MVGVIINQLMATRTKQHEILYVVDIRCSTFRFSSWTLSAEGVNMSHLREVPWNVSELMLQQESITAVEFATSASKGIEVPFNVTLYLTAWLDER
jgi:hypothetical protein